MKFFDYFDLKFVINLPSRRDRLKRIQNQLKKADAIRKVTIFPGIRFDHADDFPGAGAKGCFYSHLAVLKEALKKNAKSVLVMEDDVVFSKDFFCSQERVIHELEAQKWDMCYWGYGLNIKKEPAKEMLCPILPGEIVTTTSFYSVHSGILEPMIHFLERLLKRQRGDPEGGPMCLDGAYDWYRRQFPVATFLSVPALGTQGSSKSDITLGKMDQNPVLSPLVNFYRVIKDRFFYS